MSRHWDMTKEGIQGFSQAHSEIQRALAKYERDETAELILRDFLDNTFPGALELLTQISPLIDQYPSRVGSVSAQDVVFIDDSDARSVTMGPEASNRPEPLTSSMGPPPRPTGPLTPNTPNKNRNGESPGAAGPSSIYDVPDSPPPSTDHGVLTLQHNAKRDLDVLGADASHAPESPRKRSKKTNGKQCDTSASEETRTIDIWEWEVVGVEYIFKDERCGPGWYVIRCNLGKQPGINPPWEFHTHPLENDTALAHFNDPFATCHDSNRHYTIESIIREFAHRVTGDDLTEEAVNDANDKLKESLLQGPPKGSAKKQRKGKERANNTGSRFRATNRAGTSDSDSSYRDEMIQEVITDFLANSDEIDIFGEDDY
ncbi:hypothetical protein VPNG_06225 [Cytospora leucostoma]|uniref:Uncharacterized protein n=1 Tax=Cytospora leucostoma TaxID=1230097 RepID=A0A423WYJ3_9PEZI|nr:hypothetical protein VPNG_06225 [Cytospora leucostoma]